MNVRTLTLCLMALALGLALACGSQPEPTPAPEPEPQPAPAPAPAPEPAPSPDPTPQPPAPAPKPEPKPEPKPAPKPEPAPAPKPEPKPAPAPAPKPEPAPAPAPAAAKTECPGTPVRVAATKPGLTAIGATKCKLCHKVQYESWAASAHAACEPALDCEGCHGPGSAYKSKTVMEDPAASRAAGLVDPKAEFCRTCHVGDWEDGMMARAHAHKPEA